MARTERRFKHCKKSDCTHCSKRGVCMLQDEEYANCVLCDYQNYTRLLPCGLPEHHAPVRAGSGVRFGW